MNELHRAQWTLKKVLVEDPISTATVNLGKRGHIIIRPALKNESAPFMFPICINHLAKKCVHIQNQTFAHKETGMQQLYEL